MSSNLPDYLWRLYTSSPINFSTLTGLKYPGIPHLKGDAISGRLRNVFREDGVLNNLFEAGRLATQHSSGMCYYWLGTNLVLLITKPDDIYQYKVKQDHNISDDLPLLEKFAGPTMFTNKKEIWRQKRDACQKSMYQQAALVDLEPKMYEVINSYFAELGSYANKPLNLRTFFYNLIIDVITTSLMGCNKNFLQTKPFSRITEPSPMTQFLWGVTSEVFEFRSVFKWMLPKLLRKLFFYNEINDLELVKQEKKSQYHSLLIEPNKSNICNSENLLKKIWDINVNESDKNKLPSEDPIFGDGLFILSAGVVTTVAALEFILKLLAVNPEKQAKLQAELKKYLMHADFDMKVVNQIEYLDLIIKEALRLYPPVPLFPPRQASESFKINNIPVSKGNIVIVSPYITQRLDYLWESPNTFLPERFRELATDKIYKYAYMPFGLGPRYCIGQQFALQEIKLILAMLYLHYQIEIEDLDVQLTLKQGCLTLKKPLFAKVKLV